jgi:hypothetical protein
MVAYRGRGGLRWGNSFYYATNLSWPFATIEISPERITLTAKFFRLIDQSFELEKSDIRAIRKMGGWFSVGILFEHRKTEYPPFLLFWMSRKNPLPAELRRMEYDVGENKLASDKR